MNGRDLSIVWIKRIRNSGRRHGSEDDTWLKNTVVDDRSELNGNKDDANSDEGRGYEKRGLKRT